MTYISTIYLGIFFTSLSLLAMPSERFSALNTREARIEFNAKVHLKSSTFPSKSKSMETIERQTKYLFAALQWGETGTVSPIHYIKDVRVMKLEPGQFMIHYNFVGKIAVQYGFNPTVRLILPLDPDTVYEKANMKCGRQNENHKSNYWYYFNPSTPGCPLVLDKDVIQLKYSLDWLGNTSETYPEYSKLVHGNAIKIYVFHGDVRSEIDTLSDESTSHIWTDEEKKALVGNEYMNGQIREEKVSTPIGEISTLLVSAQAQIKKNSRFFHLVYKKAWEEGSVILYFGHSGYGENLDIDKIETKEGIKIGIDPNRYQIFFPYSCSSYAYYTKSYWDKKRTSHDPFGTKNLDIFTTNIPVRTRFVSVSSNLRNAILDWALGIKTTSFQEILGTSNSGAWVQINGDEDNE